MPLTISNIISIVVLSFTAIAHAQTVDKVSGETVTVTLQGAEVLTVGDKVSFLNEQLNVSGQGEVTKVSDGGKKALVKITSGNAKSGMSLEKSSSSSKSPRPDPNVDSDVQIVSPDSQYSGYGNSRYFTEEDRRVLRIGEISTTAYVLGGIVGTYPIGLGVGHAIQGRYSDKGWIFTAGELGSLALVMAGAGDCLSTSSSANSTCRGGGAIVMGVLGFVGFRIWEIVDVWAAPPQINQHYRSLKLQMQRQSSIRPILAPTQDGAVAGLQMTF